MFGAFALFSVAGMRMIDRRMQRALGEDWARLMPARRRVAPDAKGVVRLVLGVALFGVLLWLHGPVIGAWPLP